MKRSEFIALMLSPLLAPFIKELDQTHRDVVTYNKIDRVSPIHMIEIQGLDQFGNVVHETIPNGGKPKSTRIFRATPILGVN